MKFSRILLAATLCLALMAARRHKVVAHDLAFVEKSMALIPADSLFFLSDYTYDSLRKKWEPHPIAPVPCESFYLMKYEVTNFLYLWYTYRIDAMTNDSAIYHSALPDTQVWNSRYIHDAPMVTYYFRHPAYRYYPVVGITHEQAQRFCDSLTSWYNAWPGRKYEKVKFDLPTKIQWMVAARGGNDHAAFPWNESSHFSMANEKGQWMAGFRKVDQGGVYRDSCNNGDVCYRAWPGGNGDHSPHQGLDAADETWPVNSFFPNNYGLYCMSGNAEEYVRENGITKGGSWYDTGYYLQITVDEPYTRPTSSERGFRVCMKVVE